MAKPASSTTVGVNAMHASILQTRRRFTALAVLGLALLAVAFLFSSAPYAYADHEDGHTGTDEAPDVPLDDEDAESASDGSNVFIVGFASGVTIDDRAYTAGVKDQHSSALPEATTDDTTETPFGPFTVSVAYTATGLPDGLYLDDSRVIRGTPTTATSEPAKVTYSATGTVIRSNGERGGSHTVSLTFQVTVNPPVSFSAETVAFYRMELITYDLTQQGWLQAGSDGKVLLPAASGGTGTLTYSLVETSTGKPLTEAANGITFDPATRKLGGVPPSLDFWYVTYKAEDENGSAASFSTTVFKRVGGL